MIRKSMIILEVKLQQHIGPKHAFPGDCSHFSIDLRQAFAPETLAPQAHWIHALAIVTP